MRALRLAGVTSAGPISRSVSLLNGFLSFTVSALAPSSSCVVCDHNTFFSTYTHTLTARLFLCMDISDSGRFTLCKNNHYPYTNTVTSSEWKH